MEWHTTSGTTCRHLVWTLLQSLKKRISSRPRYIDERYSQQILRVDTEGELKPLGYDLPQDRFNALVISDYDKGFITSRRLFELVEWFDGPIFIDSKKTFFQ